MNLLPQPFDRFDLFWASYPRKTAKGDARKAFAKLKVSDALLDQMLTALEWQKKQHDWLKDGGQWVPYPASWLRAERWDDEPCDVAPAGGRTVTERNLAGLREDLAVLDEFRRGDTQGSSHAVSGGDEGTPAHGERGQGRLLPHLPRRVG